jgi:hypothetical protein
LVLQPSLLTWWLGMGRCLCAQYLVGGGAAAALAAGEAEAAQIAGRLSPWQQRPLRQSQQRYHHGTSSPHRRRDGEGPGLELSSILPTRRHSSSSSSSRSSAGGGWERPGPGAPAPAVQHRSIHGLSADSGDMHAGPGMAWPAVPSPGFFGEGTSYNSQ